MIKQLSECSGLSIQTIKRTSAEKSRAARKAAKTKGPKKRSEAAKKAARTRAKKNRCFF